MSTEDDKKNENIISSQLAIATSQLDRGSPSETITTLNSLLKEFPKESRAITLLGVAFISLGNNDKALEYLRLAYNMNPTTSNGLNLSSGLISSQNYNKALNVLKAIIAKNDQEYKQHERLYHNLGFVYEKMGKISSAITNYKKALIENPRFYLSHLQLGKIYKLNKNNPQAKYHLEKASAACVNCYESTHLLATEYINDKQFPAAIKVLKEFINVEKAIPEDKASAKNMLSIINKLNPATKQTTNLEKKLPNSKKL
ncbi:tetratricopeptide repeat protein [Dolichospermum sp. ST_sed1]|nr:tetratricopeptide repeat protein [Dolichospermum sp. ST_sed1]